MAVTLNDETDHDNSWYDCYNLMVDDRMSAFSVLELTVLLL